MRRREFVESMLIAPALGFGRVASPNINDCSDSESASTGEPRVVERGNVIELDNGIVHRAITLGGDGSLRLNSLRNLRTGFEWAAPGEPADIYLQMGESAMTGVEPGMGFRFVGRNHQVLTNGAAELRVGAQHINSKAKVTVFYTSLPNSPVIEHPLTIENQGDKILPAITRFDPLTFWLREGGGLRAYFLGETGSGADFVTPRLAGPMLLQKQTLDSTLAITGVNGNAPWLILEDATHHEFLFVWIGWTVDWGLRLLRNGDKVLLTCGTVKSSHELKPGEKLVSPRIYMGLVHGDLDDAVNAIHDQLRTVLRPR